MLTRAVSRMSQRGAKLARFSTAADKNTTQTFDYSKKNEGKSTNVVWSEGLISKEDREKLTGRKGCTIWLTGLSGSGSERTPRLCFRAL